jgi:predicted acylesterase/phospholipase RssA
MAERDLGITFSGGGNKSFYQYGLMRRWGGLLLPRAGVVAACSAGACVAALLLSGREREFEEFWRRRGTVERNFEWRRLLAGRRPTPHEGLYRALLLCAFKGGGLEQIRSQPFPFLVLTTAFPAPLPSAAAAVFGLCAYNLEQRRRRRTGGADAPRTGGADVSPRLARRVGFRPLVFDARRCESAEELADLIIATSATPPFTSVGRVGGRRLLDGGIIDSAPAFLADGVPGVTRSVVLLSAPRAEAGADESHGKARAAREGVDGSCARLYVAPRAPLPIGTWDFTRPDLLEATIERGERDAELYERRLTDFIGRQL